MTPTPTPGPMIGPATSPVVPAPTSLDPSNADWWWLYGLDGVIGGILGALLGGVIAGVATWIAVTKTLEHDRALALLAVGRADDAELRREVGELQGKLFAASFVSPGETISATWLSETFTAMSLVASKVPVSDPALFELLDSATDWLATEVEIDDDDEDGLVAHGVAMKRCARLVAVMLHGWLRDPEAFAEVDIPDWDAMEDGDG